MSLENFGGLYIGDRPYSNRLLSFVPTADNILPIPSYDDIVSGAANSTEWAWAAYGGGWGGPLGSQEEVVGCLYNNRE